MKITDADYADDLAIVAGNFKDAETLLHSLEKVSIEIGLFINSSKTKYLYRRYFYKIEL